MDVINLILLAYLQQWVQLSDEHITFIRKLTSNITLMFDEVAISEATPWVSILLQQGLNVFVIQFAMAWI